jgi:hypothetical protein
LSTTVDLYKSVEILSIGDRRLDRKAEAVEWRHEQEVKITRTGAEIKRISFT